MRCPHCEAALPARSRFCLSCGKPVEQYPEMGTDAPNRTAGRTVSTPIERPRTLTSAPGWVETPTSSRDVRGVILAVVGAFARVLGSFSWVLTRQQRKAGGVVTQLSPPSGQSPIPGLPGSNAPGLTTQPRTPAPSSGPALSAQPTNPP